MRWDVFEFKGIKQWTQREVILTSESSALWNKIWGFENAYPCHLKPNKPKIIINESAESLYNHSFARSAGHLFYLEMEDPTVAVAKVSEIQNSRKRKRWRVSFEVPFKNRFFLENLRITHTSNSNWSPPRLFLIPTPEEKHIEGNFCGVTITMRNTMNLYLFIVNLDFFGFDRKEML